MCELCIKHGEGKKWYEVMENYSKELYSQNNVEQFMKDFFLNFHNEFNGIIKLDAAKRKRSIVYGFIRKMATSHMKKNHFGQIIPLEDAEMIIDMMQSITRVPCICRGLTRGDKNARYCFAIGVDPSPSDILGDYPHLQENLETLTRDEAKKLLRKFDQEGLIHSIWTFKTPFIGGICNCDRDCLAYRIQVTADLMQIMFKGEYVADIDLDQCVGCRNCQKLCQFGAIEFSSVNLKCYINPMKCYGCGVCRSVCNKEAITLHDRNQLPELAGVW